MTDRLHLWARPACAAAVAVVALGLGAGVEGRVATAQEPDADAPKALKVRPAAEPVPSLKYRLIPLESELNPGDAAPVYLRLGLEQRDEAMQQIEENCSKWLEAPMAEFPAEEARKFVDMWGTRLRQVHYAARRRDCDWAYTLPEEREDVISILLPDAQSLRNWSRLVALKARVEVAEGKDDAAIETIETGLAFARHVGGGPFLINALVGTAMANQDLDRVEELIQRPEAPNLYWALTALPDPLIDYRGAIANEQKVVDWMFPELTDLDADRTPAEWDARLERLFGRMTKLEAQFAQYEKDYKPGLKGLDAASFRAKRLPEAKAYLAEHRGSIEGLDDAQMVLLDAAGRLAEIRDVAYRPTYLPYAQARAFYESGPYREAVHALDGTPLSILGGLLASIPKGHEAEARLERKVAALRAVEALRLYAASHDGKLPETLDAVEAVPVPDDPATGQPFAYRREGDAATLSSPMVSDTTPGLAYRITLAR